MRNKNGVNFLFISVDGIHERLLLKYSDICSRTKLFDESNLNWDEGARNLDKWFVRLGYFRIIFFVAAPNGPLISIRYPPCAYAEKSKVIPLLPLTSN